MEQPESRPNNDVGQHQAWLRRSGQITSAAFRTVANANIRARSAVNPATHPIATQMMMLDALSAPTERVDEACDNVWDEIGMTLQYGDDRGPLP